MVGRVGTFKLTIKTNQFKMKSNGLFYFGVAINAFVLLASASSVLMMYKHFEGINGTSISPMVDMPLSGRFLLWLIPFALLTLIGGAFWLKSNGKMRIANILLWIPALPMLAMILLWGGLAVLFILFGK